MGGIIRVIKGGYIGDYLWGYYKRVIKGDTGSLDSGSHGLTRATPSGSVSLA